MLPPPSPPRPASGQPFPPRTITIDRSGGPDRRCPLEHDRKFPLPEIHNPNLAIAGSRRRWRWRRYALAAMALHVPCCSPLSLASSTSSSPSRTPRSRQRRRSSRRSSLRRRRRPVRSRLRRAASAASARCVGTTPQIAAAVETDTTVENELYKIVFTNRGAQVKHWILKKYFDIGRQAAGYGAAAGSPRVSGCRFRSLPMTRR